MSAVRTPLSRLVSVLGCGFGAVALLTALTSDALGYGDPGLGWRQWLLALAGAGSLLVGVWFSPAGRAWIQRVTARDVPVSFGPCLRLGVWLGLLTGVVEVGHLAVRKFAFGIIIKQPEHVVWMAPLSFVLMFGLLAAGLGLLRQVVPVVTVRVVVFSLMVLAAWGQVIIYPYIDGGAGLALSVGVAAQLARVAAARAEAVHRLSRATLPWLVGAVVIAGLVVPFVRASAERRAIDALPAAPAGAPNVLLIVLDTVRADYLSTYGYPRKTTPHIDELARSGVVFDWPIAPCSWTLPSHATFFTGKYPFQHGADWLTAMDAAPPTLAEVLSEHGYATGGFVGNLAYCLREQGIARGFQRYEDFYADATVTSFSTGLGAFLALRGRFREVECVPCAGLRNKAPRVTSSFLGWLDEIGDRPFFAFLNYFDAHLRYEPPPGYDTMFRGDGVVTAATPKLQRLVDDYNGCIAYIDSHIGDLVTELKKRGQYENTLIVITGDHGELFGEHGLEGHANSLHRPLVHCPLVIRPPGGVAARRIGGVVSLRDLPMTVLDAIGLGAGAGLPGESLAPLWAARGVGVKGSAPPGRRSPALAEISAGINLPEELPVSKGDMKSLTADGMHYVRNGDGTEEIYELAGDPHAERNLIDTPEGSAAAVVLRKRLTELLGRQ